MFPHGPLAGLVLLQPLDHLWHGSADEKLVHLKHDLKFDDVLRADHEEQVFGGLLLRGEARGLMDEAHQVRDHLRVVHAAVIIVS